MKSITLEMRGICGMVQRLFLANASSAKRSYRTRLAIIFFTMGISFNALAAPQTWRFEDAVLENPLSMLTGQFTFDSSVGFFGSIVDYTINVDHFYDTPSGGYGSASWSGPSSSHPTLDTWASASANEVDFYYGAKDRLNPLMRLHLVLDSPTGVEVQVSKILTGSFFQFSPYVVCDQCVPYTHQEITGNIVSGVPEPETYAMMLAGLGVVGTIARRRKAALAA